MTGAQAIPEIVMNHASFRGQWAFAPFVEACAAAGMTRVSVWGDEVAACGVYRARALLRDAGLGVFGYNRAGPLVSPDPADRTALMATARTEVARAAELGADHVMAFTGGGALPEARAQAYDALAALAEQARACGIALALEPLHPMLMGDRTVLCTLGEANDLAARLGPGTGIVVDTHHVWWDPDLAREIARAPHLLGFHVNDWLVPLPHVLTGRGMMGDGIIDLAGIWAMMCAVGYDGPVEVEIFSEYWWAQPPELVLQTALARCRTIFRSETGSR